MSLARECGWLCAWDKNHWLYLLNQAGQRQGQMRFDKPIVQAVLADDGSAGVAINESGLVQWLTPDLSPVWQSQADAPYLSAALDPLGQVLALANRQGDVSLWDRQGEKLSSWQSSRPLSMLAMAPQTKTVIGAADFGFVAAYDAAGKECWRHAPVVNIGSLAVTEEGNTLLACFSTGVYRLDKQGKSLPTLAVEEPCRLISSTFSGERILCGGLNNQVILLNELGHVLARQALSSAIFGLALAPLGQAFFAATADGRVTKYRIDNK